MGRAMGLGGDRAARRRSDVTEMDHPLPPDAELARLQRHMEQLHRFASHWNVPPGCELHVDLRVAMALARWPMRHWH